jgi:F-type H+-transporting ATPase subunit c
MLYFALLALVVGLGLPLAAAGAAIAQGIATKSALEGISRQPEAAPRIQLTMIIGLALIESLVIYVLLTFFILQAKLPDSEKMLEAVKEMARIEANKGPAKVSINASPPAPSADGELVSKLTISVWDKDGVPLKGQKLSITAGEGRIKDFTDNGDGTYTAFFTVSPEREGEITIRATAENGVYDDLILSVAPVQISKAMNR